MSFRVIDEFSNDEITKMPNGDLYVQTELPLNEDVLCSYLFSFMNGVEVIEPMYIRDLMKEKIKKTYEKYIT